MRHRKHSNQLGVKKEHRIALMANMASSLIEKGRIRTTLKKAKALRPFVERLITLSKKGTLHHRRLAASRLRNANAVSVLFNEKVEMFRNRTGGYTRIYKLGLPRLGDAAEMAIIELISAEDTGYRKGGRKSRAKSAAAPVGTPVAETPSSPSSQEAAVPPEVSTETPAEDKKD